MNSFVLLLESAPPTLRWLAHTTMGASLLILAMLVLRGFLGRHLPAGVFYAAGGVVLLRLALPLTPESAFSLYRVPPSPIEQTTTPPLTALTEWSPAIPVAPVPLVLPDSALPLPEIPRPEALVSIAAPDSANDPSRAGTSRLPALVQGGWLVGLLAFLLAGTARYWRLRRWVHCQPKCHDPTLLALVEQCRTRLGLSRRPEVRIVDRLRTAAVFGVFRPTLLVPENYPQSLSSDQMRHVVLHELAHISRRDPLVGIITQFVHALHWFNPLVWITVRHFMADREVLCDESVLRCLGQRERHGYGQTLLRILRLAPPPHPTGVALLPFLRNKPEIKRRLTMIANTKTTRCLPATVGAATIATLLSLTLAAAPAQDRESEKTEVTERDGEPEKTEVRERDGDAEKAEVRERDGDAEKAEVRERDGDAEKAEVRERDGDAEKSEVRERAPERERAEVRERERAELNRTREQNIRAVERAELNRPREQEIRAVRERIGMLAREGKHEEAEALEQRLRMKLQAEGRPPEPPLEARPGNPEDLRRHIVELTEMVRQMQRSMNEMREQIQLLRQGQETRGGGR